MGALLLVAGTDLAISKRLFDARPACWPAIEIAAGAAAFVNSAVGLAAGWAVEMVRAFVTRVQAPRQGGLGARSLVEPRPRIRLVDAEPVDLAALVLQPGLGVMAVL